MVLTKSTIQAIKDYQRSLGPKSANGITTDELREALGISERQLRQLVKSGIVKFSGWRQELSACNRKYSAPVYTVRLKGDA